MMTKPNRQTASPIEFWDQDLDPQNLGREGAPSSLPLEDEIAFAATPDLICAQAWLAGAACGSPSFVVDLGAGLGAVAFYLARAGFRVIAVDSSVSRLRELRRRADRAGCADQIIAIAAAAENLPFADGSLPAILTKSVMIHVDLPKAAAEITRTLAPGGRAALIEPQPRNPFAWLYRNTLAPKEWKGITRYFTPAMQRDCMALLGGGEVRHFYLFSFLAFVFQFAWPNRTLFFGSLKALNALDRFLLRLFPRLGNWAWFGVMEMGRGERKDRAPKIESP
ncbi:class I SAM-dependent methyltransferase [Candidatus Sumerlaeota bacterium]|nr:class I SAM-dependent methyltransferase [Candidatus Sumerlaeota bacterium]